MAQGINKVILIGNLGRDPEVRFTQAGMALTRLNLAVGERQKDGDGWKDHTEWVTVAVFGKTAELCGEYLAKGRQVYVEGKLRTRSYEKDGVTKYNTEVVADTVQFLGGKGDRGGDAGGAEKKPQRTSPSAEDDLPF